MFREKLLAAILTAVLGLSCVSSVSAHAGHHRKYHHSKMRKVVSIAAPIGIGAAFGPAGSIGYQVIKHRHAIKHHLTHHHHHRR